MSQISWFRRFIVLTCATLLFAGCAESSGVKLAGKLVKAGKGYILPAEDTLNLSFEGKNLYPATFNPADGTFTVAGPKGTGIPPGKYKISLNRTPGSNDPASLSKSTDLNAEFSKVDGKEVEINSGMTSITIDLATGAITQ